MKNILYILLFVPFALFGQESNLYHIPDTAFLSWLEENYPDVIVGDSLDILLAENLNDNSIYISSTLISNLDGLQYFTKLSHIEIIDNNSLTSIPDLSGLSYLEELLIVGNNTLTSLPNLSGLENLFYLEINATVLNSLPELSLPNLDGLYIGWNAALSSLPDLSELTNLSSLDVAANNSLTSLPDLSDLINLNYLNIQSNPLLTSISELSLPSLQNLYISHNNILTSIPDLSGLINLNTLFIYENNSIINIPDLSDLSNLIYLNIYDNLNLQCVESYPEQFQNGLNSDGWQLPSVCEVDILDQLNQSFDAWNVSIDLEEGWNMIGYGCPEPIDLVEGLSNHTESILIVKNNNGEAYLPEWNFNGIGDLTPGFGYQIKVSEAIEGFSLCDWYVNDIPEDNIVSLQEENASLQAELDSIYGCTYSWGCNYDEDAILNDGSCYNNDMGCGCDTPLPSDGYDCYGNQLIANIGDTLFGGIVFFIDSTGQHGLVAAMEDLTAGATDPYGWGDGYVGYEWGCHSIGIGISNEEHWEIGQGYQNTVHIINSQCNTENGGINAAQACINHESEGYSDWYLPSKNELIEMYNAIGDVGNFIISYSGWYWSSTEAIAEGAWGLFTESASGVVEGVWGNPSKSNPGRVRPIRSF